MVLGLGRFSNKVSNVFKGDKNNKMVGFSETLTANELNNGKSGTQRLNTGSWEQIDYFSVPAQQEYMIGSKDGDSESIGDVYIALPDSGGSILSDVKVRIGYETRAGRNTDYVLTRTVSRLNQSDVEDRLSLAPKPWGSGGGKAPDDRGKPPRAREEDRIIIEAKNEGGSDVWLDRSQSNYTFQLPITFDEE